jgi:hypothetical protein
MLVNSRPDVRTRAATGCEGQRSNESVSSTRKVEPFTARSVLDDHHGVTIQNGHRDVHVSVLPGPLELFAERLETHP